MMAYSSSTMRCKYILKAKKWILKSFKSNFFQNSYHSVAFLIDPISLRVVIKTKNIKWTDKKENWLIQ